MSNPKLDHILDALNAEQQRATYGAVAAFLGMAPRTLMNGRSRDARHSWVVSRKTGEPTGYEPGQAHHALLSSAQIIGTREELETWLAERAPTLALVSQAA